MSKYYKLILLILLDKGVGSVPNLIKFYKYLYLHKSFFVALNKYSIYKSLKLFNRYKQVSIQNKILYLLSDTVNITPNFILNYYSLIYHNFILKVTYLFICKLIEVNNINYLIINKGYYTLRNKYLKYLSNNTNNYLDLPYTIDISKLMVVVNLTKVTYNTTLTSPYVININSIPMSTYFYISIFSLLYNNENILM